MKYPELTVTCLPPSGGALIGKHNEKWGKEEPVGAASWWRRVESRSLGRKVLQYHKILHFFF